MKSNKNTVHYSHTQYPERSLLGKKNDCVASALKGDPLKICTVSHTQTPEIICDTKDDNLKNKSRDP